MRCDRLNQVSGLVNADVMADFGRIDILINNAGINIRGAIDELEVDEFARLSDQRDRAVAASAAVAPHMKERRYGRVVNLGSTLSIIALADRTPYASSKGATTR